MKETNETEERRDVKSLRWASDFLCLWRVCGNARCRRARACRGAALTCADRNRAVLPPLMREFFIFVLAAKSVRLPFARFREDMDGRPETEAYFAWRKAAHAAPRSLRKET